MGAMCDHFFDLTVTCPECGAQRAVLTDYLEDVMGVLRWFDSHVCLHTHEQLDEEEA